MSRPVQSSNAIFHQRLISSDRSTLVYNTMLPFHTVSFYTVKVANKSGLKDKNSIKMTFAKSPIWSPLPNQQDKEINGVIPIRIELDY